MKSSRVFLVLMSLLIVFNLAACSSKLSDSVADVGNEKVTSTEYKFFLGLVKMDMEGTGGVADKDAVAKKAFWDGKEGNEPRKTIAKNKAIDKLHELKILLINAKKEKYKLEEADLTQIKATVDELIQSEGAGKREDADKKVKEKFSVSIDEYEAIYKDYYLAYNKYAGDIVKGMNVTDEQIKARYGKDEPKYNTEMRTVKHVLVMTKDQATNQPLPADKLKEKEKLANDILSKAKAGEDFDALVKQYSEDPGSKDKNGQYSFGKNQMVQEFEDFAFNPSVKEGDIGMVKSIHGYHIIKFIKSGTYFENEKENIRATLQSESIKAKIDKWKTEKEYSLTKDQAAIDNVQI
ncbi:MAG TPA: peptidylprolyl isomerase [Pseudobacteroides sp.]|uniref:peptidylprolyl isomerase n=1 Tax=Pseudobacteroides sp. TaxID=1968840 RepID=UPI002F927169